MDEWLTFSQHNPYYTKWLLVLSWHFMRCRREKGVPTDTSLQSSMAAALWFSTVQCLSFVILCKRNTGNNANVVAVSTTEILSIQICCIAWLICDVYTPEESFQWASLINHYWLLWTSTIQNQHTILILQKSEVLEPTSFAWPAYCFFFCNN